MNSNSYVFDPILGYVQDLSAEALDLVGSDGIRGLERKVVKRCLIVFQVELFQLFYFVLKFYLKNYHDRMFAIENFIDVYSRTYFGT